jgi:hypothetical protein
MTDDVAYATDRLRHLLDGTVRFQHGYDIGPAGWQGEAGSPAAEELVEAAQLGPAWDAATRTVLSGVRLQLLAVNHHLKSLSKLLG